MPDRAAHTPGDYQRALALAALHIDALTPQPRAKLIRQAAESHIDWQDRDDIFGTYDDALELLDRLTAWAQTAQGRAILEAGQ